MLRVEGTAKRFGGLVALDDCSLACARGSLVGLVGPNGSGKSTLFNVVTGVVRPDRGTVTMEGTSLTALKPHQIARHGIGRTFQTTRLFKSLTVRENIRLGAAARATTLAAGVEQALLVDFGLDDLAERPAELLSFGQRRLVELARALIAEPRFMLLDEPFAGLSPLAIEELKRHILALPARGVGVILIEHNLSLVMEMCERIVVLHRGRVIADGAHDSVCNDRAVIDAYLGDIDAAA